MMRKELELSQMMNIQDPNKIVRAIFNQESSTKNWTNPTVPWQPVGKTRDKKIKTFSGAHM